MPITGILTSLTVPARMPNAAWAWEFLRRNRNYREDFTQAYPSLPKAVELATGSRLIIGKRRYQTARNWGLLLFADPDFTALETDVFWKPTIYPATVHVHLSDPEAELQIRRCRLNKISDTVILSSLNCRRILFESINGSRHVVINACRYWVQLYCDTPHPIDDKAIIKFRIDGATHADKRINTVRQLLEIHRSTGRKLSQIGYRRNAGTLIDALIALDVKRMGGTYRDIACAFVGEERTADEWGQGSCSLKEKARRALVRGREYRDGKYLSLLK